MFWLFPASLFALMEWVQALPRVWTEPKTCNPLGPITISYHTSGGRPWFCKLALPGWGVSSTPTRFRHWFSVALPKLLRLRFRSATCWMRKAKRIPPINWVANGAPPSDFCPLRLGFS